MYIQSPFIMKLVSDPAPVHSDTAFVSSLSDCLPTLVIPHRRKERNKRITYE